MAKRGADTLEACARRLTRFLARKPRTAKTRRYIESLGKRSKIVVRPEDFAPAFATERDAGRYAAWIDGGKKPSPSTPPTPKKDRKRPSAVERAQARTLIERIIEYQLGRCLLCGTGLDADQDFPAYDDRRPSLDHVLPRSRGGAHVGNRLAAHRKCNSDKSNRLPTGCELVWLEVVNARLLVA
jgi:5-methylcytosine-specific restriction endonuclease McrA